MIKEWYVQLLIFNFGVVDPHPFEKEVFQKTIKKFQTA